MAVEKFIDKKFQAKTLNVIEQAIAITEDYKRRGFILTLRQLYYQFVARDLIENKLSEYKRLGSIIDDARQAGLIDWSTIEDRTRNVEHPNVWRDVESILAAVARQYKENPWLNQEYWPEVWIEKDALIGVIEGICTEYRVPYFACRGYASQSEIYAAGKRLAERRAKGYHPMVIYLGDHDPSGIHMPVDLEARLRLFSRGPVYVKRIALTMSQIDIYNPPPNPAKETDSRFEGYAQEFGDESWELDALDPDVIADLIRDELEGVKDDEEWDRDMAREQENRQALRDAEVNWQSVKLFLKHRERIVGSQHMVPDENTVEEILDALDDDLVDDD